MDLDMKCIVRDILLDNLPKGFKVSVVHLEPNSLANGYSCKVLSISVDLTDDKGKSKTLKLVMKYLPEDISNATLNMSFIKEVLMYKTVISKYIGAQKELNVDEKNILNIFPDFYGSNIENKENRMPVLLINDLRPDGYVCAEFITELDLDHTKLVIDKLAHFHAVGIKLKETNKDIFEKDFKEIVKPALRNINDPKKNAIDLEFIERVQMILNKNEKLKRFTSKVVSLIKKINESPLPEIKEPFATLSHNDLWKDNLLFKYDKRMPVDVKFIDFQFVVYNSPIRDLVYFLFTSTSNEVQKSFQEILSYYYEQFIGCLTLLKCIDISVFNIDAYKEEIKRFGWTKFKHTLSTILETTKNNVSYSQDEKLVNLFVNFENNEWL